MPDCYTIYDWSRSYLLPDHVTATIPLRGRYGEPGAYNNARGLLVEVCVATAARPAALYYAETVWPCGVSLTRITAIATLQGQAQPLTICTAYSCPLRGHGSERWSIWINHAHLAAEDRRFPPSPPWQSGIVARWLRL